MQLSIITPEKVLLETQIEMVVIPGTEGDFGVLPGHAPFISTVRPGIISIDTQDGQKHKIAIFGGIAEVVPERCTVLAETAVNCNSLTAGDVQTRLETARAKLAAATNEQETALAEKQVAWAEAIKLAVDEPKA